MSAPAASLPVVGLLVDLDRCTGCGACQWACRLENSIAPQAGPQADWLLLERRGNGLAFPESDALVLPRMCMHCDNPPCVAACPVGATRKDAPWGVVSQAYARCIGCRQCIRACPYGARRFNFTDPAWPSGMERAFSPFASARPRGVVEKCTLCAHRLGAGEAERFGTACAEACPTGAIRSGDLGRLLEGREAFTFKASGGARPRVWYVSRRPWVRAALQGRSESEAKS